MYPDRREFIERMAAGAAMASGLSLSLPGEAAAQGQAAWDLSWTDRIKGSHRAVFDCTEIEDGAGVLRALIWKMQYHQVLKVAPDDMTAVVVIRHSAIPLAMTQEFWDRYSIGKEKKVKNPMTQEPTKRNPVLLSADRGELPAQMASLNLDGLLKGGDIALACDLAFADCVQTVVKHDKVDEAEGRKRALAMLLPGIILQPSGVFATIRAQESGCHHLKAS